ncbi:hypothetical protein LINPERHAP1_LOCUS31841 [Linum perenne]
MQTSVLPCHICEAIDRKIRTFVWGSTNNGRKVLQHKYFCEGPNRLQVKNDSRLSPLWLAVKKVTPVMRLGMKMGLRDEAETNFWLDRWVDGGERLIDLTSGSSHAIDVDQPVNAFVTLHGEWNWPLFDHFLSRDGCLEVAGMSPPIAGAGEDRITWGLESDGRFRIRSAYLLATEEEGAAIDPIWKLSWRWKGPQRI